MEVKMDIKLITQLDAENYRSIRLEALKNSPEAFCSSYEEEKEYSLEQFKTRIQSESVFTFGAFENEQLIGVATLVKDAKHKSKHKATIVGVYVTPKKRGLGVAKELIQEVLKKIQTFKEIEQVNLAVVSTNESAMRLYSSLGFQVFGTEKNALKINNMYYDEDYMVLFLEKANN